MADFIVTTGEDVIDDTDNVLSLREALAQINAEASSQRQRIVFAEGVTEVEIRDGGLSLTAPNLTIDGDIDGDGLADVTLGGEVEGEYLLGASGGAALTLSSLLIRGVTVEAPRLDDGRDGADAADVNGANGRNGADGDGGRFIGVIKAEGALTLERVSISDVTVLGAD
ncbi:MAG: hypothetical protein VX463_11355, partial [Pseudomonadota bacterium]|nr:hypothetical protein [Pseudomonadota bacterium]